MTKVIDQTLPEPFAGWFAARGWTPRAHQLAVVDAARAGVSALVIAPTGGGKTLAGFLPSLIELQSSLANSSGAARRSHRLHTLYVSPLKALTVDVERNLKTPAAEMGLDIRIETRTGDTPPHKRRRQRAHPPDILLTTPEQLALLIASEYARVFFEDVRAVIVDEAHAIAPTKRGDLLALAMASLTGWAPGHRRVGLSATVHDEDALARWLVPQNEMDRPKKLPPSPASRPLPPQAEEEKGALEQLLSSPVYGGGVSAADGGGESALAAAQATIIRGETGAPPVVDVLVSEERVPWRGHSGRHALGEVYAQIKTARTALVFVNTRSQAEMTFRGLWRINDDNLAIALHHGSLSAEQRRKVEAAMTRGDLRAVVCTSTLDLGVDWGDVDLVIQMGAPKGSARLVQRIGRANHTMYEPSRALLVPSNRFEALECRAAQEAVEAGDLDGEGWRPGGLDVLAQHIMGRACGEGVDPLALYDEVRLAAPYAALSWETFEEVVELVATGGYALKTYDRFRRIVRGRDGLWRARNPDVAQRHRLNVGAIVESPKLDVRWVGKKGGGENPASRRPGPLIGHIEEWFIENLAPGDSFVFAGRILRFETLVENTALVSRSSDSEASTPSWQGGKFPLSTFLAHRVRRMISDPARWSGLPGQVAEWLEIQRVRSLVPEPDELLVETFPQNAKHYLVCYPFEGRLAHQTLGMLLTRRLERAGRKPLGFVANDYAVSVWGLSDMSGVDLDGLFDEDMLGDDLDAWLAESVLMKRTFRNCAVIAGLIEQRFPGKEKTGRQVTMSTDLIYDVLAAHEPDHILLKAAWNDAGSGLLDLRRLGDMLNRVKGKLRHAVLERVSPLAVPVMLEIGRVPIHGEASEAILAQASDTLIAEAMRVDSEGATESDR